ncbi:MAG: hypothetical protein C4K60_04000 [Ideonella sp. MAG2]|nr:MAG: hypothetical protein C4K60_04000 [Ideonella sp. MAG2]
MQFTARKIFADGGAYSSVMSVSGEVHQTTFEKTYTDEETGQQLKLVNTSYMKDGKSDGKSTSYLTDAVTGELVQTVYQYQHDANTLASLKYDAATGEQTLRYTNIQTGADVTQAVWQDAIATNGFGVMGSVNGLLGAIRSKDKLGAASATLSLAIGVMVDLRLQAGPTGIVKGPSELEKNLGAVGDALGIFTSLRTLTSSNARWDAKLNAGVSLLRNSNGLVEHFNNGVGFLSPDLSKALGVIGSIIAIYQVKDVGAMIDNDQ